MTNQGKAYVYAGVAIFFWSTVASVFKIALNYLDVVQLLFFATWTSFIVYFFSAIIQGKIRLVFKCTKGDILRSSLLGFLNPFIYYLVLFKAYSLLPAQVAQPLNMIWPIILVFLSIPFLGQKIAIKSFIALFISFTGVYLISSQGAPLSFQISEPFGVLLAVGSSLIWSFYWIFNVRDKREALPKLLLNFFFASIYISILTPFVTTINFSHIKGILLAEYAGLFEMGFSFLFWLRALKLSKTSDKISNLVYIAPFISLILIHIFVGEMIYSTTISGLCLIVGGIIIEKIR